jgi:hypothetical protein
MERFSVMAINIDEVVTGVPLSRGRRMVGHAIAKLRGWLFFVLPLRK